MIEGRHAAIREILLLGAPIAQFPATAGVTSPPQIEAARASGGTPGTGPHLREAACRLVVDFPC